MSEPKNYELSPADVGQDLFDKALAYLGISENELDELRGKVAETVSEG